MFPSALLLIISIKECLKKIMKAVPNETKAEHAEMPFSTEAHVF